MMIMPCMQYAQKDEHIRCQLRGTHQQATEPPFATDRHTNMMQHTLLQVKASVHAARPAASANGPQDEACLTLPSKTKSRRLLPARHVGHYAVLRSSNVDSVRLPCHDSPPHAAHICSCCNTHTDLFTTSHSGAAILQQALQLQQPNSSYGNNICY